MIAVKTTNNAAMKDFSTMNASRTALCFTALLLLSVTCRAQWIQWPEPWEGHPVVVHEWGVHEFDWSQSTAPVPAVPGFMYTERKPGVMLPPEAQRVKEYPLEFGIRTKPILYFYPPNYPVQVGVEVRFANGHAHAWWPQANVYRTPAQVAHARPFDWETFLKQHSHQLGLREVKVPDDERFELAWNNLTLTQ